MPPRATGPSYAFAMGYRPGVVLAAALLAAALSACSSAEAPARPAPPSAAPAADATESPAPSPTPTSTPAPSPTPDAAAVKQAREWLSAATVPPDATPIEKSTAGFMTVYGWPCEPVERDYAFWAITGWDVIETRNWLDQHPPAGLTSTSPGPLEADPDNPVNGADIGFIPEPGAQEGIVFSILQTKTGVEVRAEAAARTSTSTCPKLPDDVTNASLGIPGLG